MVEVTDRIRITFEGEGAGTEELSWGQLDLWLAMDRMRTWLPVGFVQTLPEGTSVADVVSELRFMMSRYQSMRTRLQFDPGGGPPRQVVAGSGEVWLEVVDADRGADPAQVAAQLQERYEESEYDFAADWPVRAGVVRHQDRPTHQVIVMCHLATDAGGGRVIATDLASRDPYTGEAARPVAAMQPVRLAQWQQTAAGQRQNQRTLRHAERVLREMPARRFGDSQDQRRPRYWEIGFKSRAMELAVRSIAARTGQSTAPVLLTAYAAALARVSGTNPAMTRVLVGNRFRSELADVVAPISQGGLLLVDLAGTTFDEALTRVRRRALGVYKHAYFDPRELSALVDRIGQERGEPIEVGCFFNDRRVRVVDDATQTATGPAPTGEEVLAALPETTLHCERQQDEPLERLFVHVNDVADVLDFTVLIDTGYVSPSDVAALLHTMESVAVDGALDPSARTLVTGEPVTTAVAQHSGRHA